MKEEITAAVLFISKLVRQNTPIEEDRLDQFGHRLGELLEERFCAHWHPNQPWRGQGYRCLRVNENLRKEPTIERAAQECGLSYEGLNLPVELTIWVDPEEVCCRFGEHKGSCCTIASFVDGNKENNVDNFDFSQFCQPVSNPSTVKSVNVLQERTFNSNNIKSPPSSTQSTPTKKNSLSPSAYTGGYNIRSPKVGGSNMVGRGNGHQSIGGGGGSPGRRHGGVGERRPLKTPYHFNTVPPTGPSYSPPFYKTQSWVNLSQTPPPLPPPPPHHLPMFTSTGFIYPPNIPPHYTHSPPSPPSGPPPPTVQFNRSPPHMTSGSQQKFKWNNGGAHYLRNERHQWLGQRTALARV